MSCTPRVCLWAHTNVKETLGKIETGGHEKRWEDPNFSFNLFYLKHKRRIQYGAYHISRVYVRVHVIKNLHCNPRSSEVGGHVERIEAKKTKRVVLSLESDPGAGLLFTRVRFSSLTAKFLSANRSTAWTNSGMTCGLPSKDISVIALWRYVRNKADNIRAERCKCGASSSDDTLITNQGG